MVFEPFNNPARRSVYLSQAAARLLGHPWIGTGHLLLGVLCKQEKGEDLPQIVGQALGLSHEEAYRQAAEILGNRGPGPSGHIKFTERTKGVIRAAVRESQERGDTVVHTGHLLLGFTDPLVADPAQAGRQPLLMRKARYGSPDFYDIAHRLIANATTLDELRVTVLKVAAGHPTSTVKSPHGTRAPEPDPQAGG